MISSSDILNAKILVVDDQEANVRVLERILSGAGYACIASTMDPREVCELHRKNRYDLILLDLRMPGMDGFQVLKGLKEIETGSYLPALVLTAQPDHKLRALQAGAKDFVSKPFDEVELLTRIHNMLEVGLLQKALRKNNAVLEQTVLELKRALHELNELAITDPLTGLLNRRYLREGLPRELMLAQRRGTKLAVIMIDIDHFKRFNDTFGHEAGDLVLSETGALLKSQMRKTDIACRFGGEEFAIFLIDSTFARAERQAEEFREAIKTLGLTYRDKPLGQITASLGMALFPDHGEDADVLLRMADRALYEAKRAGRDCVISASASSAQPV